MILVSAALALACAFCLDDNAADPAPAPSPAPRVIAVHDDDPDRGLRSCWVLTEEIGAEECAVLPGLPELGSGLVFTVYTDDRDTGENALIAVNAGRRGVAIGIIAPADEAPAAPYAEPSKPVHAA